MHYFSCMSGILRVDIMVSTVPLSSNNLYPTSYVSNKQLKLTVVKTKLLISHCPPIWSSPSFPHIIAPFLHKEKKNPGNYPIDMTILCQLYLYNIYQIQPFIMSTPKAQGKPTTSQLFHWIVSLFWSYLCKIHPLYTVKHYY